MSFTTGLYYPWIDIRDENWLKSAALYWESIRTIVPVSVKEPYSTRTAKELQDASVLVPLRVESSMDEIEKLTDDVVKFLDTSEAAEFFMADEIHSKSQIHIDKMSRTLDRLTHIHPEKLPYEVRHIMERSELLGRREGDWYNVDARFADFYMTLLATRLSDRFGVGLLTNTPTNNKLAVSAKLDASLNQPIAKRRSYEYEAFRERRKAPSTLAQGILADLIIEKIKVDPNTPVSKLLKFRAENAAALGRFRSKIGSLTQSVSTDMPAEHLQQTIYDIYKNEVLPATNAVKEGLDALGIKWITENYLKVAFLSTSTTSMMAVLGLAVPQALLVGAGISLTASIILYNLEKKKSLRENPFAYVLAAEKAFS